MEGTNRRERDDLADHPEVIIVSNMGANYILLQTRPDVSSAKCMAF